MDGGANRDVFRLDFFACRNAREISFARFVGNIGEIKIEHDFCSAKAARYDEVGIHRVGIYVDHEIRIEPVVQRAAPAGKWTPLQAITIA